jgi:hypothetical protein
MPEGFSLLIRQPCWCLPFDLAASTDDTDIAAFAVKTCSRALGLGSWKATAPLRLICDRRHRAIESGVTIKIV